MQLLEVMVGFGIAGTGFGVILAVVGRAASDENRSMALGIATAAGSAGQVIGAPLAEWLMTFYSWQGVFIRLCRGDPRLARDPADHACTATHGLTRIGARDGCRADAGVFVTRPSR